MEEQSKKKAKEVKMNVGSQDAPEQKYTYEQLNEICGRLFHDNQYLKEQLRRATEALSTFDRLAYLIRIVECACESKSSLFCFDLDFVNSCIQEIQDTMSLQKTESSKEDTQNEEVNR